MRTILQATRSKFSSLNTSATPFLSLADTLPTGGKGGASSNAGILRFSNDLGAVANFGSNSVTQLMRYDDSVRVAKGPGSVWYTANSPGAAISEFFTDDQGGVFYKSIPLPGSPSDITMSADQKLLAVIYTVGGRAQVAVFSIDAHGDLTRFATSDSINVPAFSGVAISE